MQVGSPHSLKNEERVYFPLLPRFDLWDIKCVTEIWQRPPAQDPFLCSKMFIIPRPACSWQILRTQRSFLSPLLASHFTSLDFSTNIIWSFVEKTKQSCYLKVNWTTGVQIENNIITRFLFSQNVNELAHLQPLASKDTCLALCHPSHPLSCPLWYCHLTDVSSFDVATFAFSMITLPPLARTLTLFLYLIFFFGS